MNKSSLIKVFFCVLLSVSFLLAPILAHISIAAEENDNELIYSKDTPILNTSILAGYYLYQCDACSFPVKIIGNNYTINRDIKLSRNFEKTKKVKRILESWGTVSHEEMKKDKKKWEKRELPCRYIKVERYFLDSPKDAQIFASAYRERFPGTFVDGFRSINSLGETCWTDKNSDWKKSNIRGSGYENGSQILFIRNSVVVRVDGAGLPLQNNSNPMPSEFVEKVARAIDNKLK